MAPQVVGEFTWLAVLHMDRHTSVLGKESLKCMLPGERTMDVPFSEVKSHPFKNVHDSVILVYSLS